MKIGSIGALLPGFEAQLAEDGELLVRSGAMMTGYYKNPERTAEAIDADGWMHTGDVAVVDDDGYYRLIDRKKDLIITALGKNISPTNIENMLKEHALVGQTCVIGDKREYITALIVLEATTVADYADPTAEIEAHIAKINEWLSGAERIVRFTILPGEWTTAGDELTPTLKTKRPTIATKYADQIEAMYALASGDGGGAPNSGVNRRATEQDCRFSEFVAVNVAV